MDSFEKFKDWLNADENRKEEVDWPAVFNKIEWYINKFGFDRFLFWISKESDKSFLGFEINSKPYQIIRKWSVEERESRNNNHQTNK